MIEKVIIAGIGFVIGAFCPSVLKKIKSWFSSEGAKVVSIADAEDKAAEADIKKKL